MPLGAGQVRAWQTGRVAVLWIASALAAGAQAQAPVERTVYFLGRMGDRALLSVDGQTRILGLNETVQGVKLLALRDENAELAVDGQVQRLRLGEQPQLPSPMALQAQVPAKPVGATVITLRADPAGHFFADGFIQGLPTRFLVDTGATGVTLSQREAERLGLPWRTAPKATAQTANGALEARLVVLPSLTVGGVTLRDIGAVVLPSQLEQVLLGNSFLTHFRLRRDDDVMRLELKPDAPR